MQYLFAAMIFAPLAVWVIWLNVEDRKVRRRLADLPEVERERLEDESRIHWQANSM